MGTLTRSLGVGLIGLASMFVTTVAPTSAFASTARAVPLNCR